MEKSVTDAIRYRRSVRKFKSETELDDAVVARCLEHAVLAPTSSNLQLWEFYHITDKETLDKMTVACLGQNAAKTAKQLVVVVARRDLWRQRARANVAFLKDSIGPRPESEYSRREKFALTYYRKIVPSVYTEFLGILGLLRSVVFRTIGLFRPIYKQVRLSDLRIIAHKSAALAAQNFMLGMAAVGYDTCPMEGSDTGRVKKILGLPRRAEITMVIGCGVRAEDGIYTERFRVPFASVYKKI